MKTVSVRFSEELLSELDATSEVREKGRSAVLRQLASDFLRQRREREIDAQYERAYAGVEDPLGQNFEGWEQCGRSVSALRVQRAEFFENPLAEKI
jgi:predicted transcriptional regulator